MFIPTTVTDKMCSGVMHLIDNLVHQIAYLLSFFIEIISRCDMRLKVPDLVDQAPMELFCGISHGNYHHCFAQKIIGICKTGVQFIFAEIFHSLGHILTIAANIMQVVHNLKHVVSCYGIIGCNVPIVLSNIYSLPDHNYSSSSAHGIPYPLLRIFDIHIVIISPSFASTSSISSLICNARCRSSSTELPQ